MKNGNAICGTSRQRFWQAWIGVCSTPAARRSASKRRGRAGYSSGETSAGSKYRAPVKRMEKKTAPMQGAGRMLFTDENRART